MDNSLWLERKLAFLLRDIYHRGYHHHILKWLKKVEEEGSAAKKKPSFYRQEKMS